MRTVTRNFFGGMYTYILFDVLIIAVIVSFLKRGYDYAKDKVPKRTFPLLFTTLLMIFVLWIFNTIYHSCD